MWQSLDTNSPCMVDMLRSRLDEVRVVVPDHPEITGALGAALHGAVKQ